MLEYVGHGNFGLLEGVTGGSAARNAAPAMSGHNTTGGNGYASWVAYGPISNPRIMKSSICSHEGKVM
jgi:hypothetical protein